MFCEPSSHLPACCFTGTCPCQLFHVPELFRILQNRPREKEPRSSESPIHAPIHSFVQECHRLVVEEKAGRKFATYCSKACSLARVPASPENPLGAGVTPGHDSCRCLSLFSSTLVQVLVDFVCRFALHVNSTCLW